jgi:hypothetical protein
MVQMEMIFRAWASQTDIAYLRMVKDGYHSEEILVFQESLSKFTKEAIGSIESNIGND